MSEHDISCLVICQNTGQQQKLLEALRTIHSGIQLHLANDVAALKAQLAQAPMLLFYCVPEGGARAVTDSNKNEHHANSSTEQKLLRLIQHLSRDCILVRVTGHSWQGLSRADLTETGRENTDDICTIATADDNRLRQQLDYLLAYARLKYRFRQCKHLLSIAELRSQWLVEYSREAVAYIAQGRHLQANIAYSSLFGFGSEVEVRDSSVLKLVQPEDQEVFAAVSREAEKHAKPSNKLLLNLNDRHSQRFRAEIRFIPSVYQGRRCVQLHVHPLMRHSSKQQTPSSTADETSGDPWQKHSATALKTQQQKASSEQEAVPTALSQDALRQLHPAFQELLNLQGNSQLALLLARPWLQYTQAVRLDYAQLLANAHDDTARFRLDYWNLLASLDYLAAQKTSPVPQRVVVSLGRWALTSEHLVAKLLKLLKTPHALNTQLVLAFDSTLCLRGRKAAEFLLPLYSAAGVGLMFTGVCHLNEALLAQLDLFKVEFVQTHESYAVQANADSGIPEALQVLLQQLSERNTVAVVSGVQDIKVLNLFCETTAGYLQGPVLDKFSR